MVQLLSLVSDRIMVLIRLNHTDTPWGVRARETLSRWPRYHLNGAQPNSLIHNLL